MIIAPRNPSENALLARWASERLGIEFDKYQTLGVLRGGQLAAVAVYHDYREGGVQISFVSDTPRWASREALRVILIDYPFDKLKVNRVTAVCRKKNKRVRRLLEGVGFKLEGVHRKGFPDGDACSYGLLKEDFKL